MCFRRHSMCVWLHTTDGLLSGDRGVCLARVFFLVAQIFNLPYRRLAACRTFANSGVFDFTDGLPITNRRYSRVQLCATLNAYVTAWLISRATLLKLSFTHAPAAIDAQNLPGHKLRIIGKKIDGGGI